MDLESLPEIVQRFAREYPDVWSAYNQLGEAAAKAGPLDASTERLVKLALAIGGRREGAVRSHARRALAHGLSREQLEHVAVLAITTIGWPAALAALAWIDDEVKPALAHPT
jgi:alkylhydroperoxidase/carboxymuconolactone decarboxylase family protein YurZ